MPCFTRMKTVYLRGLLWLYLLGIGYEVVSVEPGYLDFDNLPDTNFSCVGKVIGGYYADLETNCQMFHVCTIGQLDEPMDIRFLCLNGTVFDQETRVCERIDEVDCSKSEKFYSLNLELYGNTQPSISEDNAETDPPIIIKASTTTTTTTTTQKPKTKTTKASYFTTATPTVTTKIISSHHFPISNGPDIRFNPEEINISLHPGSSPSVRSKTVAYQQQVFNGNDNKKVVVTTHTSYGTPEKEDFVRVIPNTQRPQVPSTQKLKPPSPATPADVNYGFTYHHTENGNQDYTEPPHNYQYQRSNIPFRHGQFRNQFKTTTYRTEHVVTTRKHPYIPKEPTTFRTPYVSSVKTPTYHTYRTDKPQRLQLPIPLLPTLPPLTFSSPAPFTLGNHIETKRYTSEHQTPPRIIISASASVSDNSGRRLNYSLGTIGVTPLLEEPPKSYDDYKDHDVVLDPFYHDVPKIKSRRKRQTKTSDVNSDQAAVDVLKFLFDWYNRHQKTSTVKVPINPEDITEINQKLAPIVEVPLLAKKTNKTEEESVLNFQNSALFNRKSKFNIIGDILSVTEDPQVVSTVRPTSVNVSKLDTLDYVDDNYEAELHLNSPRLQEKNDHIKISVFSTPQQKEEDIVVSTEMEETDVTTVPPTTTTTEPTTTSKIMGIMRSRARAHHKRIMNENRLKYTSFLTNIKPKIRRRQKSTTETRKIEEIVTTSSPTERHLEILSSTTKVTFPPLLTTATSSSVKELSPTTSLHLDKEDLHPSEQQYTTVISTHNVEEQHAKDPKPKNNEEQNVEETQSLVGAAQPEESQFVPFTEQLTTVNPEIFQKLDDQLKEESQVGDSVETTKFELTTLEAEDEEPQSLIVSQNDTTSLTKEEEGDNMPEESFVQNNDSDLPNQQAEQIQTDEDTAAYVEKENSYDEQEELLNKKKSAIQELQIEDAIEKDTFETGRHNNNNNNNTKETFKIAELEDIERTKFQNTGGLAVSFKETIPKNETSDKKVMSKSQGRGRSRFQYNDHIDEKVKIAKYENNDSKVPKNENKTIEETLGVTTIQDMHDSDSEIDDSENEGKHLALTTLAYDNNIDFTTTELSNLQSEYDVTYPNDNALLMNNNEDASPLSLTEPTQNTFSSDDVTSADDETTDITPLATISTTTSFTENNEESTTSEADMSSIDTTETTITNDIQLTTEVDITSINLTPAEITTETITTRGQSDRRRTRRPRIRTSSNYRRPNSRHRFSTEITSRPTRRKPAFEKEYIDALTSQLTTTESLTSEDIYATSPEIPTTTPVDYSEDVPATDAPLFKSANPTQAESAKESLHTTPLSMLYKLHVRKEKLKSYIFNCFGKPINKFYSDPRDCRLFHYCTSGYTKNQLLDMKFVCDLGTYFDDEKLICTKTKPERCL